MWQYVIAGLVLGGLYAIAASGLVVTYQSAGVLNFAFGALAYFVARLYYFLNTQHGWPILPAAFVSIILSGPALGVLLYAMLFRFIRLSSTLVKIVATVGLSVAIPPLSTLIFGNVPIVKARGLAPLPVRVFRVIGVPVTMDQIIVYGCVIVVVVSGVIVLRYTDAGLRVRAMVDSPAMTSLSGTSPGRVSLGVWAASVGLAGLVGVLAAPIIGLDAGDFTLLMVAAFAAVIAARLRSLPVAVVVGLAMGIAGALVQHWLPPSSSLTADVIPSIPFIFTAGFLLYFTMFPRTSDDETILGGALDRAIATPTQGQVPGSVLANVGVVISDKPVLIALALVSILPALIHGYWLYAFGQGVAYGVIYLAFTLVVGEGGMIWLCIATFAGIGGLSMAQLTTNHGWPVIYALLVGGLIVIPFGMAIGFLTIRLGNLYVAIVTLIFGLLMENLVFSRNTFFNGGVGVSVNAPKFAASPRGFAYLALVVFVIMALLVVNLRRSSTGLALGAIRTSEVGAKTLGISVLQMKLIVAGGAAFVAGIGGGLLAMAVGNAQPGNYSTLGGLVWLAVVVTLGIRSNIAALFAGLASTMSAGIAIEYLPKVYGNVPPILFALGAIFVAKFPEGTLAMQARQIREAYRMVGEWETARRRAVQIGTVVFFAIFIGIIAAVPKYWWATLLACSVIYHAILVRFIVRGETYRALPGDRGVTFAPELAASGVGRAGVPNGGVASSGGDPANPSL